MLGPQHLPHLIAYFDSVDAALSQTFLRPVPPEEVALTGQFCALMDAATQRRERLLAFNIDDLNAALAACGDDLHFDLVIETHQHSSRMESLVSQSDFGLVIEYQNLILPAESRNWHYLMQAKRLHRSPSSEFDDFASFKSVDHAQHRRLQHLADTFGPHFFRYFLFCPAIKDFLQPTATKIRALHTRNLSTNIFDYTNGLTLFDYVRNCLGRVDSGVWVAPSDIAPSRPLNLHNEAFVRTWSFTWFMIQHFRASSFARERHHSRVAGESSGGPNEELIRGVICGQEESIEKFCELAFESDVGKSTKFKILPRNTITITTSVGRSLSPDTRRAIIQD